MALLGPMRVCAQGQGFMNNPDYDSLRILLMGDIQQSAYQIASAYDDKSKHYDYDGCFYYVQPMLGISDLTIANLCTNFAGKPYTGGYQCSAPDEFAMTMKQAGINMLLTANDHSADYGIPGMERTNKLLDSLQMYHTGTFKNEDERSKYYPAIIERNGFRIAVLNYTVAANHLLSAPAIVNIAEKEVIKKDLIRTRELHPDYCIVYFNWGTEYQRYPNLEQKDLAKVCFEGGADLVVGSHPHVMQRIEEMEYFSNGMEKTGLVAYSLGTFYSDIDRRYSDGAAMLDIIIAKNKHTKEVNLAAYGFIPTYNIKVDANGKKLPVVVPISEVESNHIKPSMRSDELDKMRLSAVDTRNTLNSATCLEVRYPVNDKILSDVAQTIVLKGGPVNRDKTVSKTALLAHTPTPLKLDTALIAKTEKVVSIKKDTATKTTSPLRKDTTITAQVTKVEVKDSTLPKKTIASVKDTLQKVASMPAKKDSLLSIKPKAIVKDTLIAVAPTKKDTIVKKETIKAPLPSYLRIDTTPVVSVPDGYNAADDQIKLLQEKYKGYTITYKVKFYEMRSRVEINTYYYRYLEGYETNLIGDKWNYYLGNTEVFNDAKDRCLLLRSKGLKGVEIIPFINGKKLDWPIKF
jgi:poly-gamma-glutamate capsule biosynthesis protein CapA/YwtB (metallophosphatase superfamily)